MARKARRLNIAPFLRRLDPLIDEADAIRSEATTVAGEWKRDWFKREMYRTEDWAKIDSRRFTEWRAKCAPLLAEMIPKGHLFENLPKELSVLPCTAGHLDRAISTLKGIRAHFSAKLAADSASKPAKEGTKVRDTWKLDKDEDDEERPVAGIGMRMGTPESEEVFQAICDECERADFDPLRVDLIVGSARTTDKFKSIVEDAAVMILDLSDLRPNVLRETGYVEAKHDMDYTILLARVGTALPSDIAPRPVLFYKSTEHLRTLLRPELETMNEMLDDDHDEDNENE